MRPAAVLLLAALLATACATAPAPAPAPEPAGPQVRPEDRPYLVPPLEGWRGAVSDEQRDRLAEGFAAVEAGQLETARALAEELAPDASAAPPPEPPPPEPAPAGPPSFPPAVVLAAQADLVERRPGAAAARLEPLAAAYPDYTALQLLLGRAAEESGDLIAAFSAFRRLAEDSLLAFDRVEEMRPRVAEILGNRVAAAVDAGDLGAAEAAVERLRAWAPETVPALRAAARLARARGDRQEELAAVRGLAGRLPEERELAERRAELELAVGDPKTGLDLFAGLAARHPDDPRLAERLAYAKFRWRVAQMPPRVEEIASKPVLERGDAALLLFWLVPRVRSERPAAGRIASDILDDPRREEIARVVNLGLMDVDPSVHRFDPGRPAVRGELLRALLRALERFAAAPCTAGIGGAGTLPRDRLCEMALGCGLVRADELCAASEPLSGGGAVELIRRTLDRLERLRTAPAAER